MKVLRAILASLLYAALVVVVYIFHARFFHVDVVLYSALLDVVIATVAAAGILFSAPALSGSLCHFEKSQLIVIWLLAGYAFAISVPTVIDRSLSFYILEKIQQRGGGIPLSNFDDVFRNEYVKEHRLTAVRLTEQEVSGTVTITNGCVVLTERGEMLATFSRFFRKNLLPKHRLIQGQYTSDLTDPFRQSQTAGPICK